MKKKFYYTCLLYSLIAVSASSAQSSPSTDALSIVADVQDNRIADLKAVQAAIKTSGSKNAKAAILVAFQQRESERATQAGAASLKTELARQATVQTTTR